MIEVKTGCGNLNTLHGSVMVEPGRLIRTEYTGRIGSGRCFANLLIFPEKC